MGLQDIFSKKPTMQSVLAIIIIGFAFIYMFGITFFSIPAGNKDYVMLSLGFITGGAAATVITFFFGNSKKQEDPGSKSTLTIEKKETNEGN